MSMRERRRLKHVAAMLNRGSWTWSGASVTIRFQATSAREKSEKTSGLGIIVVKGSFGF